MRLLPVRGSAADHVTACPFVMPDAIQPAHAEAARAWMSSEEDA